MTEHMHNDELHQRLANAERERDMLAEENGGLSRLLGKEKARVRELDAMLEYRVGQYLELKAVLDLRQELGSPFSFQPVSPPMALIDCVDTLSLEDTANGMSVPVKELQAFLIESYYPVMCPCHGFRLIESHLDRLKTAYNEWTVARFRVELGLGEES